MYKLYVCAELWYVFIQAIKKTFLIVQNDSFLGNNKGLLAYTLLVFGLHISVL